MRPGISVLPVPSIRLPASGSEPAARTAVMVPSPMVTSKGPPTRPATLSNTSTLVMWSGSPTLMAAAASCVLRRETVEVEVVQARDVGQFGVPRGRGGVQIAGPPLEVLDHLRLEGRVGAVLDGHVEELAGRPDQEV